MKFLLTNILVSFLSVVLCGAIFTPTLQLVQFGSRDVFWRPDNSVKLSSSLSESKIPNLGNDLHKHFIKKSKIFTHIMF